MELHKPYIAVRNGDGTVYNFTVTKVNKKTVKGRLINSITGKEGSEVIVKLPDCTIKGYNYNRSLKLYEKYSDEAVELIKKYNNRMYAIQVRNYIQNIVIDSKVPELIKVGKLLKLEPVDLFS